MRLRRVFSLSALSLIGLLALPSVAQGPDLPPQGALYLGGSKMLEAARPRQLTLNANVAQFLYQPGGLEMAYLGTTQDGDTVTQSVCLIGLKRGEATTLVSETSRASDNEMSVHTRSALAGWSGDGRFLLIEQTYIGTPPKNDNGGSWDEGFLCVDVGADPIHLISVPLPPITPAVNVEPEAGGPLWQSWWSPGKARLLFAAAGVVRDGDAEPPRHKTVTFKPFIYDPARQRATPLTFPDDEILNGWLDEGHVLLYKRAEGKIHYFAHDLTTGTQTEISLPKKLPTRDTGENTSVSPKDPRLSLDVEERFHPDRQGVTGIDSHLLWLRRASGVKKLSALPVGLTPDKDDPQAHWSPTGQQIAFVSHGDLFLTDLSVRAASPRERLIAGELPCPEEEALAKDSLKRIGLGLIQYEQDNDGQLPPADDVNNPALDVKNRVMPYIKDAAVFQLGDNRFVYHGSGDLNIAKIETPAEFVLGTLDTPCAHNVLYADGHVKSFPKP